MGGIAAIWNLFDQSSFGISSSCINEQQLHWIPLKVDQNSQATVFRKQETRTSATYKSDTGQNSQKPLLEISMSLLSLLIYVIFTDFRDNQIASQISYTCIFVNSAYFAYPLWKDIKTFVYSKYCTFKKEPDLLEDFGYSCSRWHYCMIFYFVPVVQVNIRSRF